MILPFPSISPSRSCALMHSSSPSERSSSGTIVESQPIKLDAVDIGRVICLDLTRAV